MPSNDWWLDVGYLKSRDNYFSIQKTVRKVKKKNIKKYKALFILTDT